jgi:hypothetical protein
MPRPSVPPVLRSRHQVGVSVGFRFELPANRGLSISNKRRHRSQAQESSDHAVDSSAGPPWFRCNPGTPPAPGEMTACVPTRYAAGYDRHSRSAGSFDNGTAHDVSSAPRE